MDTDERLSRLEQKIAEYDRLIEWLKMFARMSPKGRIFLRGLGL